MHVFYRKLRSYSHYCNFSMICCSTFWNSFNIFETMFQKKKNLKQKGFFCAPISDNRKPQYIHANCIKLSHLHIFKFSVFEDGFNGFSKYKIVYNLLESSITIKQNNNSYVNFTLILNEFWLIYNAVTFQYWLTLF